METDAIQLRDLCTASQSSTTASDGLEDHHRVPARTADKMRIAALVVSWCSVLFSFSTGVAALVLASIDKSEALFGYGACIVMGSLFVMSGVLLTGKSLHSIVTKVHETKAIVLYTSFCLTTGIVSVILALVKVYLGYKLESEAMATDSIITFVGAAMSFAGVAGLELYVQNTKLWYMDSVFGIICGVFLLCFGIKLLYEMLYKTSVET